MPGIEGGKMDERKEEGRRGELTFD